MTYQQQHYGEPDDRHVYLELYNIVHTDPYADLAIKLMDSGWTYEQLGKFLAYYPLMYTIADPYRIKLDNAYRDLFLKRNGRLP